MKHSILPRISNNPIIHRESIVRMRTFSSFLFLGAVMIIGSFLMVINFESIRNFDSTYIPFEQQVQNTFGQFNILLLIVIGSIVPFISASSINSEKERETWDLLATTPLRYSSIYAGKFISSLGFVWLLFIALMPFYGLYFLIGGVSFQEVLIVFAGLTEITIIMATIGLLCSCNHRKTIHSVTAAFIIGMIYLIGIPFLWIVALNTSNIGRNSLDLLCILSPLFHMTLYISANNIPLLIPIPVITALHILFTFILILIMVRFSFNRMADIPIRAIETIQSRSRTIDIHSNVKSFMNMITPNPGFPDKQNPVYIKDMRMNLHSTWVVLQFGLICIGTFIGLIVVSSTMFSRDLQNAFDNGLFLLTFAPLFILPYAGNCFRFEKDQNSLDLLLTTNLSSDQIVQGKIKAGLSYFLYRYSIIWGFVFLFTSFIFYVSKHTSPYQPGRIRGYFISADYYDFIIEHFIIATINPVLLACFLFLIGMFYSTVMKNTNTVYASTFFTAGFIYFILPLLAIMIRNSAWIAMSRNLFNDYLCIFSPLVFMSCIAFRSNAQFTYIHAMNVFCIQTLIIIGISLLLYYRIVRKIDNRDI